MAKEIPSLPNYLLWPFSTKISGSKLERTVNRFTMRATSTISMRIACHRHLCSWQLLNSRCFNNYYYLTSTNLYHNLTSTQPCNPWSMVITCYQVQIMRGESPKVLCVSHARCVTSLVLLHFICMPFDCKAMSVHHCPNYLTYFFNSSPHKNGYDRVVWI